MDPTLPRKLVPFGSFVRWSLARWEQIYLNWILWGDRGEMSWVFYEDMLDDPVGTVNMVLENLGKFAELIVLKITQVAFKARLLPGFEGDLGRLRCLSSNPAGNFKRERSSTADFAQAFKALLAYDPGILEDAKERVAQVDQRLRKHFGLRLPTERYVQISNLF